MPPVRRGVRRAGGRAGARGRPPRARRASIRTSSRRCTQVEDRHFWFVGRRQVVLSALRRAVPDLASRRLFDVGCGSGGLLAFLSRSGVGVAGACDVYPESLRLVRAQLDAPLVLVDEGRPLPLGRGYDLLGMFDVLEHIDDDVGALRALRESLAPGGALVLTVPAHQWLFDEMDEIAFHRRRYDRAGLRRALEESGFEVRLLSHFMSPLVPLLVLMRSAGRRPPRRALARPGEAPGGVPGGAGHERADAGRAGPRAGGDGARARSVRLVARRRGGPGPLRMGSRRAALWIALTIGAVALVQQAWVSPTNFGGADEWLLLDLSSRGVLGVPYANRPLVLLWQAPAAGLFPGDLRGFWLFATLYFAATRRADLVAGAAPGARRAHAGPAGGRRHGGLGAARLPAARHRPDLRLRGRHVHDRRRARSLGGVLAQEPTGDPGRSARRWRLLVSLGGESVASGAGRGSGAAVA